MVDAIAIVNSEQQAQRQRQREAEERTALEARAAAAARKQPSHQRQPSTTTSSSSSLLIKSSNSGISPPHSSVTTKDEMISTVGGAPTVPASVAAPTSLWNDVTIGATLSAATIAATPVRRPTPAIGSPSPSSTKRLNDMSSIIVPSTPNEHESRRVTSSPISTPSISTPSSALTTPAPTRGIITKTSSVLGSPAPVTVPPVKVDIDEKVSTSFGSFAAVPSSSTRQPNVTAPTKEWAPPREENDRNTYRRTSRKG
jgi:hypothetical protein